MANNALTLDSGGSSSRDVPGYLALLNLEAPEAVEVVRRVIAASVESENRERDIATLLAESDWRPHLIALVGALAVPTSEPIVSAMWGSFDRGSWVTPQLAVGLYFLDPQFEHNATVRLTQRCGLSRPGSAREFRDAKAFSALREIARTLPGPKGTVDALDAQDDVVALLAEDPDCSGELTMYWWARVRAVFAKCGVRLTPASDSEQSSTA